MKQIKTLIFILLMALCTVGAEAKTLALAVTGGVNNSTFSIKGDDDAITSNLGYQAALALNLNVPILSLSTELCYSSCSFNLNDASILGGTAKVRSNALDVPVLLGLTVVGPLKLEVGPRFTIYDKATAKFDDGGDNLDVGEVRSSTGYVMGVKLTLVGKIIVGARFNGQFANPETDFNVGGSEYKLRNYSYSINVGYVF